MGLENRIARLSRFRTPDGKGLVRALRAPKRSVALDSRIGPLKMRIPFRYQTEYPDLG